MASIIARKNQEKLADSIYKKTKCKQSFGARFCELAEIAVDIVATLIEHLFFFHDSFQKRSGEFTVDVHRRSKAKGQNGQDDFQRNTANKVYYDR